MKRCIAFCLALGGRHLSHRLRGRRHRGGLLCEASGIRPDTVLLSVDGRDVSAQRYLYWLAYACDYIADYYDSGRGSSGGTLSPARAWRITPRTRRCRTPPCTPQWRPGRRITAAPSPTRTGLPWTGSGRPGRPSTAGRRPIWPCWPAWGLDRAEAEAISGDYYLYEHLYDLYCTEGSELAPAEHDLETFAQEQGYLTVDHIWLSTAAADPADAGGRGRLPGQGGGGLFQAERQRGPCP